MENVVVLAVVTGLLALISIVIIEFLSP